MLWSESQGASESSPQASLAWVHPHPWASTSCLPRADLAAPCSSYSGPACGETFNTQHLFHSGNFLCCNPKWLRGRSSRPSAQVLSHRPLRHNDARYQHCVNKHRFKTTNKETPCRAPAVGVPRAPTAPTPPPGAGTATGGFSSACADHAFLPCRAACAWVRAALGGQCPLFSGTGLTAQSSTLGEEIVFPARTSAASGPSVHVAPIMQHGTVSEGRIWRESWGDCFPKKRAGAGGGALPSVHGHAQCFQRERGTTGLSHLRTYNSLQCFPGCTRWPLRGWRPGVWGPEASILPAGGHSFRGEAIKASWKKTSPSSPDWGLRSGRWELRMRRGWRPHLEVLRGRRRGVAGRGGGADEDAQTCVDLTGHRCALKNASQVLPVSLLAMRAAKGFAQCYGLSYALGDGFRGWGACLKTVIRWQL